MGRWIKSLIPHAAVACEKCKRPGGNLCSAFRPYRTDQPCSTTPTSSIFLPAMKLATVPRLLPVFLILCFPLLTIRADSCHRMTMMITAQRAEGMATWSAATDKIPISSYRVFRGTSANSLIQVGTTYSTPTAYPNYSLAPSTKYYFGVEAVDTDGNVSPMSAIGSASTLALPTAPSKPVAAAISTTATPAHSRRRSRLLLSRSPNSRPVLTRQRTRPSVHAGSSACSSSKRHLMRSRSTQPRRAPTDACTPRSPPPGAKPEGGARSIS